MSNVFQNIDPAKIIKAVKDYWGVIALAVLVITFLAFVFFRKAPLWTRITMFLFLLIVATGFGITFLLYKQQADTQKQMLEARSIFRVRVTVADEAGRPIENARIWANVDTVPKKVDGGWELDVPAGALPANAEMIVMAEDNDNASHGRTSVKLGSEEQVTATLQLVPDNVEIRGV